jgi:EAL domain-containing protein (putative c-di-GMP-specific phosphodiesterase class I)
MAQTILKELRASGLSVAIDDFGTGYSSLSSLRQFEIDCLKVDRSFVNQIHTPAGEEICKAIIALGHALGMRIVAEGVETDEQSQVLRALQCDEVQGYLYGKPMAPQLAVKASAVDAIATKRVVPYLKAA